MSKKCIVHYSNIKIVNQAKFTAVDESRYEKLRKAKSDRLTLGGSYITDHKPQCDAIPDVYVSGHYYHLERYKQFTRALSDLKNQEKIRANQSVCETSSSDGDPRNERPRRSTEKDGAGRFPLYCMICKKMTKRKRKRDSEEKEEPTKFRYETSVEKFRKAVEAKNDKEMRDAIEGVDLLVKDFMKHESCWRDYTSVLNQKHSVKTDDPYDEVRKVIKETVLEKKICISLDTLLELQGITKHDANSRKVMKRWIQRNFESILFLSGEDNTGQLIMSKECLHDISQGEKVFYNTVPLTDQTSLRHAALILRKMILEHAETSDPLPWPPTVESLEKRLATAPDLLMKFFKTILEPENSHKVTSDSTGRLVSSFAQDLMFAVSKGTFLTLKHTSVGLGLHNMVGQKLPIIILSHLGQSITYHSVREIETAQAELSEHFANNGFSLPIQPRTGEVCAPTIFWWDNFDTFVDTGIGSIHNTPGIAFQEETTDTRRRTDVSIERSKRTSLVAEDAPPLKKFKINPKKDPPKFQLDESSPTVPAKCESPLLILWKALRKQHESDQVYPKFSGFVINYIQKESKKTIMTYLPPIETPITEYGTIYEMFERSEKMSKQGNMKYTHIVLDCGAAIKAYHVLWNNADRFKNIIIHLGDFHTMQAIFGVLGSFISGSGFEDIVYQLGLCQPGTMKALIKGKHYNQAWMIHESLAEAISRLFIDKFIPSSLLSFIENIDASDHIDIDEILVTKEFLLYAECYADKISDGLAGKLGRTAQYWLTYVKLVNSLHSFHFSIQTNDFDAKLKSLKSFCHCFSFSIGRIMRGIVLTTLNHWSFLIEHILEQKMKC